MFNYEGELWADEDYFGEEDLFWRFRIIDAPDSDRAMAEVLARWSQQFGAGDIKVGTRVSGVNCGNV